MRLRQSEPRFWDTDWLIHKPMLRGILNHLANDVPPESNVVDLGCGEMPYRARIEALGLRYRGADITDKCDVLIAPNGTTNLQRGSADAILSIQVLEHVRDLESYFAEVRRLLKPDGSLILSTHGWWLYHPHPEDNRRWTRAGLIRELEAHGFVVESVESIRGPLATTTLMRLTGFAYFLRKIPAVGRVLGGLLSIVMNARAVVEDALTPKSISTHDACVYLLRAKVQ